jgi:hypothetical protein
MAATDALPEDVAARLAEFCAAAKSGNLQIDIKNGHIVSAKLTELFNVDRGKSLSK